MALRVLLADESSTIKKVMQLALQEYFVEVKSVPVGSEVLEVAKSFSPDIIFADVLLAKKTGYEVCQELKSAPETQKIPVVLMWSGFIDFDANKAQEAKADRSLEKPFDAELLRRLVQELVPKTQENPLSQYLEFPQMPDFSEPPKGEAPKSDLPLELEAEPTQISEGNASLNFENEKINLDEIPIGLEANGLVEEFQQVPLVEKEGSSAPVEWQQDDWQQTGLKNLSLKEEIPKIQKPEGTNSKPVPQESEPEDDFLRAFSKAKIDVQGEFAEVHFDPIEGMRIPTPQLPNVLPQSSASNSSLNLQAEVIVREEARAVIEKICWQIIPDIAEKLVRQEIERLMKEIDTRSS